MSASNAILFDTNVSNFVSVKLSGKHNYLLWKAQMLCMLDSNNMGGIVDATFVAPTYSGTEIMRQYDSLVRGWIFGSVSEVVLEEVYNIGTAKAVWEKLQSNYDDIAIMRSQEAKKEADAKTEKEALCEEGPVLTQVIVSEHTFPSEMETENEDTESIENNTEHKKKVKNLKSLIIKGDWPELKSMLKEDIDLATEAISSDGSTILHIAVGMHRNNIVKKMLRHIVGHDDPSYVEILEKMLTNKRDSDGSTVLHVAAIVGNKFAADRLLWTKEVMFSLISGKKASIDLLRITDRDDKEPLQKAYENMHLDTIACLLEGVKDHTLSVGHDDKFAVNLLVNAISAKRYSLASQFLKRFPKAPSKTDEVLMALAKTYPCGLHEGEKLIYPSLRSILEMLRKTAWVTLYLFAFPALLIHQSVTQLEWRHTNVSEVLLGVVIVVLLIVPICMLASAFAFICLLMLTVSFPFFLLYFILWKGGKMLTFPPIMKIENKIMEQDEAKKFLVEVCNEMDKVEDSGTRHPYYEQPILEAACQNAHDVVDEILSRSPEAIQSRDKSEYDIIQLAIINRSEKVYNLIYDVDERKNIYKTYKDPFKNNILHLAGRLAPSSVLNQRTGAALQLQRELQWREEVKKLVIPTYITEENNFKETPDIVFTREHKDLVKEGEQWMKTTSESCSITAALIITIVFAAAITVPGGNNQEKGTPLFRKETAFIIFAISDAISLFASSTALLVFLSILTACFSEKDFLVSLPWRLFIGLFSLLLSTTTMMVAFSATLFLVFCDKKLWMIAPICGLAFIPIAFFVGLQFPLMVDLFSSTYLPIFGKERKVNLKIFIRKTYEYMFDILH